MVNIAVQTCRMEIAYNNKSKEINIYFVENVFLCDRHKTRRVDWYDQGGVTMDNGDCVE